MCFTTVMTGPMVRKSGKVKRMETKKAVKHVFILFFNFSVLIRLLLINAVILYF